MPSLIKYLSKAATSVFNGTPFDTEFRPNTERLDLTEMLMTLWLATLEFVSVITGSILVFNVKETPHVGF